MKNSYNKKLAKIVVTSVFLLAVSTPAFAQIGLPGDGSGDVGDAPAAAIDGFIGIALAIGTFIGAKKLRASKA